MSKSKLRKFAEMRLYENYFNADFDVLRNVHFPMRGRWNRDHFMNYNPIVLELGCGKGEYTVGLARLMPEVNFIGVDIKGARMYDGATKALNENLTNVAFVRTHIEYIEAFFAPGEVEELWITFPDPQMQKPRKRLVGTMMLHRYQSLLRNGGMINLKTDSPYLYTYTRTLLDANGITPVVATDDLYATQPQDPALSIRTYYEDKWTEHGLTTKYIRFSLPSNVSLVEPTVDIPFDTYRSAGRGVRELKE